ncbi:hypothetical protein LSAT2_020977 [Lamellibrachia satsuma]|nr:hypothetical protein LSAT2_020977 [Lamellibrachia satsuma]
MSCVFTTYGHICVPACVKDMVSLVHGGHPRGPHGPPSCHGARDAGHHRPPDRPTRPQGTLLVTTTTPVVGKEQVGYANGSGGGTVDDKVG